MFAEVELQEWWQRQSDEQRATLKDAARKKYLDPATIDLLFETRCPVGPIGTSWESKTEYIWTWPEDVLLFINAT